MHVSVLMCVLGGMEGKGLESFGIRRQNVDNNVYIMSSNNLENQACII